jgi:hypothetical protein
MFGRVTFNAVSAAPQLLALGANTGSIYLYRRAEDLPGDEPSVGRGC